MRRILPVCLGGCADLGGVTHFLAMSDNRDYKTLPSLQPAAAKATVWEQTQMGPKTGVSPSSLFTSFLWVVGSDILFCPLTVRLAPCNDSRLRELLGAADRGCRWGG